MQDSICDTLGTLSIQSHAVWTLQHTGHLQEVDGSSPNGCEVMPCSGLPEEHVTVLGFRGILQAVNSQFC